jgi:hypothetical protein
VNNSSTDAWAEKLVQVVAPQSAGPWSVQLCDVLDAPVSIFEHENPAVVEAKAKQVRAYLKALHRQPTRATEYHA